MCARAAPVKSEPSVSDERRKKRIESDGGILSSAATKRKCVVRRGAAVPVDGPPRSRRDDLCVVGACTGGKVRLRQIARVASHASRCRGRELYMFRTLGYAHTAHKARRRMPPKQAWPCTGWHANAHWRQPHNITRSIARRRSDHAKSSPRPCPFEPTAGVTAWSLPRAPLVACARSTRSQLVLLDGTARKVG